MTTAFCNFIQVNSLGFEDSAYPYGIEGQIGKTDHAYNIAELDIGVIGYIALEKAYDSTSHNHHDQQSGALIGMLAETVDS